MTRSRAPDITCPGDILAVLSDLAAQSARLTVQYETALATVFDAPGGAPPPEAETILNLQGIDLARQMQQDLAAVLLALSSSDGVTDERPDNLRRIADAAQLDHVRDRLLACDASGQESPNAQAQEPAHRVESAPGELDLF